MAVRYAPPNTRYFDDNGQPLSSGKIYFYEPGTTTPKDSYSDAALSTANANPVVLGKGGLIPDIFLSGEYRVIVKDKNDVQVDDQDDINEPIDGVVIGGNTPANATFTKVVIKDSTFPDLELFESGAAADDQRVTMAILSTSLFLYLTEAGSSSGSILSAGRDGTTLESIAIGNSTANPYISLHGFTKYSYSNSVTAGTTQTQAGATLLTTQINRVDAVGTTGDGVKLPVGGKGLVITIINDGANSLQVWPSSGDAIDGEADDAVDPNSLAAASSRQYVYSGPTGKWYTI